MRIKTGFLSYILILLFTVSITILVYFINGKSLIGIDDANIYMIYMRNAGLGHGFVFNVGGERVEGFTSLLWTLIGAMFYAISSRPEICLLILNILIVSYAIWRVCGFINTAFNRTDFFSDYVFVFLILLISVPGYYEWTVLSLMETGLWSSLIILSILNILEFDPEDSKKIDLPFSLLLCMMILCRPEAILWCAFFLAVRFFKIHLYLHNKKAAKLRMIIPVLVCALTLGLLFIWRKTYFGYWLPNTYYAKVSSDRLANIRAGMKYLVEYFRKAPFVFLIFILLVKQIITWLKAGISDDPLKLKKEFPFVIFTGIFLVSFTIPLVSGGDHFAFYRMIQPAYPLMLLYFLFAAGDFHFTLSRVWKALICIFVVISSEYSLFYTIRNPSTPLKADWEIAVDDRKASEKLNRFFSILPDYPTQGVLTTGGSAYAYKGITFDLLGLNLTKMAHADAVKDDFLTKDHASFNKSIFFELHPDLFFYIGGFEPVERVEKISIPLIHHLIFKRIADDERFNREYTQCVIFRKGMPENLQLFASRKFLNSLDTAYYRIIRFN